MMGSLIYIAHAAPDKPLIISSRHFILFLPYGGLISYKLLMACYSLSIMDFYIIRDFTNKNPWI